MRRNRIRQGFLLIGTALLGLASRRFGAVLPAWLAAYAGDTLWALLVSWLVGFAWPRWSAGRVAAVALAGAFAVEISQLYQAAWLNAMRHTTLGGLALGHGFLWSDLVCYCVGVALGYSLERAGWWLFSTPRDTPYSPKRVW